MIYTQDGNKSETDKYNEIWKIPEYCKFSPGLRNVERFMEILKPSLDDEPTIIDVGCGQGAGGLELERLGFRVWYLDLVRDQLAKEIDEKKFIHSPIWGEWKFPFAPKIWDYGFCCDVMEHIPTEFTMLCLDRIIENCTISWFNISLIQETYGEAINDTLHMTVRPFDWWLTRLGVFGKILDARDLLNSGLYVVER